MHEAMAAENIIESVLSHIGSKKGRVVSIVISCGQLNALNDEAMEFAFAAAAEGTVCKGAKLKIKHIPLMAKCSNCKKKFSYDFYNPQCPKCGHSDIEIGEDSPLLLEEIEFEEY